ncbi:hypothetical protein M404DRAFT_991383 [Pisolithus tinctorius Marx 270]|uniref:Uncharacterized protein n=1 Tax=Pisolithus tinctorius Marx 270 TaxID=870435 RepID=A0A0C3PYD2_PISTI|nr:hypothetical protein M404DRAFT_991383 [Pisolithus tinctorius Marx 270]
MPTARFYRPRDNAYRKAKMGGRSSVSQSSFRKPRQQEVANCGNVRPYRLPSVSKQGDVYPE